MNGSSWGTLLKQLNECGDCDLLCWQEHHTLPHLLDDREETLRKKGWQVRWKPAIVGKKEHSSYGGVAILSKIGIGLDHLKMMWIDGAEEDHRCVCVLLRVEGFSAFLLGSVYVLEGVGMIAYN